MDLMLTATRAIEADTAETPRPRSLSLALRRMGFRPRPDRQPRPHWPSTWPARARDDAAADWLPL